MIRVHVKNQRVNRSFVHSQGPIEFGRVPARGECTRFVLFDDATSKCHLRVTEIPPDRVKLENTSSRSKVFIPGIGPIEMNQSVELELPVTAVLGQTRIELSRAEEGDVALSRGGSKIGYETIAAPVALKNLVNEMPESLLSLGNDLSPERLLRWFEMLVGVQRAVAGSPEFYRQTIEALVQLVGMDQAVILLHHGDGWQPAAELRTRPGSSTDMGTVSYSRSLVDSVAKEKRTLYRNSAEDAMYQSLASIESVVASPILDASESVVGVLYASRAVTAAGAGSQKVGPLEAQVVQLLAAGVGTGLVRLEREAEAVRSRVQFEQFFSRELSEELGRNPTLLEGREREVSVLFTDIRGFSRLAQRLGARQYYRMAQDILSVLTQRVQETRGVVVDYTGDGLLAMWNAPFDQPTHAVEACKTALAMAGDLPGLRKTWEGTAGGLLDIGIGINTGPALVGNTGTPQKMKYGPRGHTVNLGSRIEGVTKQFGTRIIISQSTRDSIGDSFPVRRLGKVQLAGLLESVDLYELCGEIREDQKKLHGQYERALSLFENAQFAEAAEKLRVNLAETSGELDVPTFQLLARVIQCQKSPPANFDPKWIFDVK